VQFFFDRKDSLGNSALNAQKLANLHKTKRLSEESYKTFASLLDESTIDAVSVVDWLNDRFNGELVSRKGHNKTGNANALGYGSITLKRGNLGIATHSGSVVI